ncbi:40S ribosomal protein S9, mitochondrial precursor [Aaosphaeria arxii CBS 175.79]|uniref:Small ribosomal subunit protein uS9m n=1 Tax=Aaosphaeria arxii CBS 175.79 TaxID=1450172 RepID=A0A6A5X7Q8_9PLEO|nr:40S ribosomal protein S9, mitochondrial precursor [Aaosphaeria arxii CBS 175.79]KAF2008929.1 40S ribosomal protein S9, mitochondrial precursor [Aaosphaeria arxii CBS 175.79]
MARGELSRGLWRAFDSLGALSRPQCQSPLRTSTPRRIQPSTTARCITTSTPRAVEPTSDKPEVLEKFTAAPEIEIELELELEDRPARKTGRSDADKKFRNDKSKLAKLRVVPASPSYFSAKPTFTDDVINLLALLRKVATLPTVTPAEAPKVAWKTIDQYRIMTNEPVKTQRFHKMLHLLRRLNCVHPSLMPQEVLDAMKRYKKDSQPGDIVPSPGVIDELGRAKGVGRRKTSSATAYVIEGEGEVLVNGKSLTEFFGRLHDRESAVWALKATQRLDKYNVFALVNGGGVTGQAEAITLAVAKALLVHEPALKPALRRAGCVTRDPRKVERKKPGHIKARKMPTWVKR